ncbi:MAG: Pr6Pr family membrane protein [Rhodoglobus sp.]
MSARRTTGVVRLALASVGAVALIARFIWGMGSAAFTPINYFAYLTIQSTVVFVVVTLIAAVYAFGKERDPARLTAIRACVVTCTVTAGILFAAIVSQAGSNTVPIDVSWSDAVLHFWLPPLAVLEWFLSPGRGHAPWRVAIFVLGYTLIWGGLTMVRGDIVGWYPYYFLDPGQLESVGEFAMFSGMALTVFAAVAFGVVALSRIGRKEAD